MSDRVHLTGLVVEPGRHTYPQPELAEALRRRLEGLSGVDSIRQMVGFVYAHSTITQRHIERPLPELERRSDWYRIVNEATFDLARRALARLVEARGDPGSIDGLVVVSSSFAGFPSLGRRLQSALGIGLDAACYDLAGLGCAGPTHGLHLAHMLLGSGRRRVAMVCADALATHGESRVHHGPPSMSQLVAHCLASDGAAAVLVEREPSAPAVLSWGPAELRSRLWPDTLGENDFTASADGQPFISVGKGIRTRLRDELLPLLEGVDPASTLFHPGGAALMKILGEACPPLQPTLDVSSAVLRDHGNIGSASVLWVLDRALRQHLRLGPVLRLVALGPGIVSTMLSVSEVRGPASGAGDG